MVLATASRSSSTSQGKYLAPQSKAWEERLQHLCCLTWAVGGHKQHSYTVVTAVALYGPIFPFIWFILYLSAHDSFCFASRLHRASYLFLQRFVHLSLLVSFTLPVAKFLLVNEPGRPLQNQPWQLKNQRIFLSNKHRVDLLLCPYLWLTSPDSHSSGGYLDFMPKSLACIRSRESGHKPRADVPSANAGFDPVV